MVSRTVLLVSFLTLLNGLGLSEAGEGLHMQNARQKLAFLPEFGGLGVPNRTDSLVWLRHYFASTYVAENHTEASPYPEWGKDPRSLQHTTTVNPLGLLGKGPADTLLKRSLVVAIAGDGWSPDKWFFRRGRQEFSLAVIYIGQSPRSFQCPECSHVWRMQGLKWQLIQRLSASSTWDALAAQYHYVMFADDDLIMQAEDLNIVFRVMAQYQLMLAQPSLCKGSVSWMAHLLTQRPGNLLRYTTFVEIMAPTFDMGFFTKVVRHTFFTGITGYGFGADHLWPALLRYPSRGIAVIDAVCMVHPQRVSGSIYDIQTTFAKPTEEADILNGLTKYRDFRTQHNGGMRELSAVRLHNAGGEGRARRLRETQHQQLDTKSQLSRRNDAPLPSVWRHQPGLKVSLLLVGAVGAAAVCLLHSSLRMRRRAGGKSAASPVCLRTSAGAAARQHDRTAADSW